MIRRPPRSTRTAHSFPTRRSSDLERETDVAIAVEVPQNAPIGSRWLGEGELVVLYREADMPEAPPRLAPGDLREPRLISVAASGPPGEILVADQRRPGPQFSHAASAHTFLFPTPLHRRRRGHTPSP